MAGIDLIFVIASSRGLCAEKYFFIIAKQYLLTKAFSASQTILPVRQLGVHKELGGQRAGTADPK